MKTKEFIRKVEEFGFELVHQKYEIQVWGDEYEVRPEARILKTKVNRLILNSASYSFIKLCMEYAETPLEEREEEKKYTVVLPDPEDVSTDLTILFRTGVGKILIGVDYHKEIESNDMYHLTEAEIKRNHEYLWQFAKEVKI